MKTVHLRQVLNWLNKRPLQRNGKAAIPNIIFKSSLESINRQFVIEEIKLIDGVDHFSVNIEAVHFNLLK